MLDDSLRVRSSAARQPAASARRPTRSRRRTHSRPRLTLEAAAAWSEGNPAQLTGLTGVLMANGTVKPISEVKAGDRNYVDVVVKTDAGPKTIETTKHHQFYEIIRNSWTQAGDLEPGQELQDGKGESARILDVIAYTAERTTYDLSVEGLHTDHVLAGLLPVLVHNCKSGENGGWYGGLTPSGVGKEVNHIPAKSPLIKSTGISEHSGPAIRMDYADHRAVYSTGFGLPSQAWHMRQKELMDAGDLRGAIQMDVDDIRARFGSKYDVAITEMWMSLSSNKAVQKWAQGLQNP
ncbi:Hint domain-containing protein [Streptomyces cyaneofuscatus]